MHNRILAADCNCHYTSPLISCWVFKTIPKSDVQSPPWPLIYRKREKRVGNNHYKVNRLKIVHFVKIMFVSSAFFEWNKSYYFWPRHIYFTGCVFLIGQETCHGKLSVVQLASFHLEQSLQWQNSLRSPETFVTVRSKFAKCPPWVFYFDPDKLLILITSLFASP